MWSFWELDVLKSADVIVVGSGFTGISVALSLKEKEPSLNVAVLDRDALSYGASSRNAGFSCFGSITELEDDLNYAQLEEVVDLVQNRFFGIQKTMNRILSASIDYEQVGGFELITDKEEYALEKIAFWNKQLHPIFGKDIYSQVSSKPFSFSSQVKAVIKNSEEGMLHPVKLLLSLKDLAISKGIRFYNGWNISLSKDLDELQVQSSRGTIGLSPLRIVLATNAFSKQILSEVNLQLGRGQVLVTKPIDNLHLDGTFHFNKGYVYFRNFNNRLVLGGGRDLYFDEEATTSIQTTEKIQSYLKELAETLILPQRNIDIEMAWSGIMAFGEDKTPICKFVSNKTILAARLGGMGVALASQLGEDAALTLLRSLP